MAHLLAAGLGFVLLIKSYGPILGSYFYSRGGLD